MDHLVAHVDGTHHPQQFHNSTIRHLHRLLSGVQKGGQEEALAGKLNTTQHFMLGKPVNGVNGKMVHDYPM